MNKNKILSFIVFSLFIIGSFIFFSRFFLKFSPRTRATFDIRREQILQLTFDNTLADLSGLNQAIFSQTNNLSFSDGVKNKGLQLKREANYFKTTLIGLTDTLTLSFWIKGDPKFPRGKILTLLNDQQKIELWQESYNGLRIRVNDNILVLANNRKFALARNYKRPRFFNITLTIDTNTQRCYLFLDGKIDYNYGFSLFNCPINSLTGTKLVLGSEEEFNSFQGIIDELSIWKRILNQQEIIQYIKETFGHYLTDGICSEGENSLTSPQDCPDNTNLSFRLLENGDFTIWYANPLIKIWRQKSLPTLSKSEIELSMGRNESRIFQIILTGKSPSTTRLDLNKIDLLNNHSFIKTQKYFLSYVNVLGASENYYFPAYVINNDPRPDPLIPLSYYSSFFLGENYIEVTKDNHTIFVFEITTSPSSPKGEYQLVLRLNDVTIPVKLTILDFSIPDIPTLKTLYSFNNINQLANNSPAYYHGINNQTPEKKMKVLQLITAYFDAYADHRISPYSIDVLTGSYTGWFDCQTGKLNPKIKEKLRSYLDKYLNQKKLASLELTHLGKYFYFDKKFSLCGKAIDNIDDPSSLNKISYLQYKSQYLNSDFVNFVKIAFSELADFLKENQWLERLYFFVDEPIDPKVCGGSTTLCVYRARAFAEIITPFGFKIGPLLPNPQYFDTDNRNTIIENGDWFNLMGVSHNFSQDKSQKRTPLIYTGKTGEGEFWWYHTDHEAFDIDSESVETYSLYWQMFFYNISGSLQWAFLGWTYEETNPWRVLNNKWGGNGNIILFYPPCKDGPCTSPNFQIIPSFRLKLIREAITDHAYLKLAEQKIGRQNLVERLGLLDIFDVNQSKSWSEKTILLYQAREKLKKILDSSF